MLLPTMGFFLMLVVVGGLGSLVALADPNRSKLFPFTLAMVFSGSGFYILGFGLTFLGENIFGPSIGTSILFLVGLLLGSLGGATIGFIVGRRRNRRASYESPSTDKLA